MGRQDLKQKIAVFLLMASLGSPALRAEDTTSGMIIDGIMIGGGALMIALPFFTEQGQTGGAVWYTAGGILAASGIAFLIVDLFCNNPATMALVENHAVLKHVSFAIAPDKVYMGFRFNLCAGAAAGR
jgi:hypothetical protein